VHVCEQLVRSGCAAGARLVGLNVGVWAATAQHLIAGGCWWVCQTTLVCVADVKQGLPLP